VQSLDRYYSYAGTITGGREYEYAETLPLEPPRPEVVEKSFSSRQPDATPDNTTPQTTTQLPEAPTRASVEVTVPEITSTAGLEAPRVTTAAATGATTNLAGQVAAAASGGSAAISAQPAATPAVTDDGTIASTPIQAGWNIQVASFVRDVNAIKLLNKLRERNLPAYANRVAGDTRSVIRVVVGPYANQIDALASQNRIDQDFRVESLMVKR